jgi:hypothetical protein
MKRRYYWLAKLYAGGFTVESERNIGNLSDKIFKSTFLSGIEI